MIENGIRELFARYPEVIFGFADISYSPFYPQYRSAIVIAVPYGKQLTTETYTEQGFEDGINTAKVELESILHQLEILCQVSGTAYFIPPMAQTDEKDLLAPFSYKYAATRAGIGWIGKNDVVITRRYGPRVRLSAMLVDAPLPYGEPVTESRCPDGCTACVEACPCNALRNVKWDPSRQREEIIDYHRCNRMRSAYIPKLGRKEACGRCFAACPVGAAGEGGETQTV